MSLVSKMSSRSSSSGFSSFTNDRFLPTLTLQTVLDIQRADINVRTIFCGEQDCRLNELRHMTGAIIDLNIVPGTRRAFERVNWTISHHNSEVRDFVVRRLNYWMQQTQLACDMIHEDELYLQEKERNRVRNLPPPPLSTANFSRRYRTRSLTHSDAPYFNSKRESVPSTPSGLNYQHETPFTGLLGRTLSNLDSRPVVDRGRFYTPRTDRYRSEEIHASPIINHVEMSPNKINELMESAKWAGVLSDSTDNELHDTRVCFADTISLSKLAEMIRNNELQLTSNLSEIEHVLEQSTMNITSREQMRQFDGKCYWFHRVILDNHIQFPPGISQDANESRRLAYRHLIDVCTNAGGVKMKMLTNNRVKVVKGQQFDKEDLDINATYISTADLSCLSHCQMVY